jgi:hypothetical protein
MVVAMGPVLVCGVPTLLFLAVVLGVTWYIGSGIRPDPRRRPDQPNCGRCGYSVLAATSLRCSECGSDFRRVGIRTGVAERTARLVVLSVMWTSVVATVGVITVWGLIPLLLPEVQHVRRTLQATGSRVTGIVGFDAEQHGRRWVWPWQHVDRERIGTVRFDIDASTGEVLRLVDRLDEPGVQVVSPAALAGPRSSLDEALLDEWLIAAGIDPQSPTSQQEKVRVMTLLERRFPAAAIGPVRVDLGYGFNYSQHHQQSSGRYQPIYIPAAASLVWLIIWLVGLWRIARPPADHLRMPKREAADVNPSASTAATDP